MEYTDLQSWYRNAFAATMINKFFTMTEYGNLHPYEFDIYNTLYEEKAKADADQARAQDSLQRRLEEKGY